MKKKKLVEVIFFTLWSNVFLFSVVSVNFAKTNLLDEIALPRQNIFFQMENKEVRHQNEEQCLANFNEYLKTLPVKKRSNSEQLAPTSILSPVIGALRVTTTNQGVLGFWEFNRHMTGFHRPGGGINGSNDTHAWDVNLYLQGNTNADAGRDVYATASGTVVSYAGVNLPNSCNAVLIAHPNSQNPEWYSGYLHLNNYNVFIGQSVTSSNIIGNIGRACADNDHLHFVVYTGSNTGSGLVSFNTTINERTAGGCSINIGQGTSGSELAAFQNAYNTGGGQSALGCATASVRFDGFTSFAGTRSHYQTTSSGDIEYHTNGSRAGQAFAILAPFLTKWASFGYNSGNPLGYPIGFTSQPANSCYGTQNRYQSYEGGSLNQHLSGSRNGQIFEVHGAIHRRWELGGFAVCPLGMPTSDETTAQPSGATGSSGKLNQFEGGQIYWKTNASEAYQVHGAIYNKYVSMGGSASWLGFPTSNEFVSNGYPRSNFEGGYITTPDGVNYLAYTYSSSCPGSVTVNPSSGQVGSQVTITGNNFTGVNSVRFFNNVSAQYSVNSNTQIVATVPSGAATGVITIGKPGCSNVQTQTFTITNNPPITNRIMFDFDGDRKADVSVYRPSDGIWHIQNSQAGYSAYRFGLSTDKIVPADYDGDGKTDYAVYRPSNGIWYIQRTNLGFWGYQFGLSQDIPMPADYDGDGKADVAVYRPSNGRWYIQRTNAGYMEFQFGLSEDKPAVADYDGDGKADIAVYRPSNGIWYLQRSNLGFTAFNFGLSTDLSVPSAFVY